MHGIVSITYVFNYTKIDAMLCAQQSIMSVNFGFCIWSVQYINCQKNAFRVDLLEFIEK